MARRKKNLVRGEGSEVAESSRLKLSRPVVVVHPRSLRENDAAAYVGFSSSYLRNLRHIDSRRRAAGQTPIGPVWYHFQTAVRYFVEDLDAWLDSHRRDPGQGDPDLPTAGPEEGGG